MIEDTTEEISMSNKNIFKNSFIKNNITERNKRIVSPHETEVGVNTLIGGVSYGYDVNW